MEEDLDDLQGVVVSMKIIVIGNGRVGKTSMITRFAKNLFTGEYKKTLGCDFLQRNWVHQGTEINMMLWDTAGQEEYNALTRRYYKGAAAAIIAFSTIDRESFESVTKWRNAVLEECGEIPMILIQNKVDMIDEAKMSSIEVENLARTLNLKLFRTCVKENLNITESFDELASAFIREGGEFEDEDAGVPTIGNMTENTKNQIAEREQNRTNGVDTVQYATNTGASTVNSGSTASSSTTKSATPMTITATSGKRTIQANTQKSNSAGGAGTGGSSGGIGKNSGAARAVAADRASDKFQLGSKQVKPTKSRTGGKKGGGCTLL